MPKKKKYVFYLCKDCEIDFLVAGNEKKFNCPDCGDKIHVEVIKPIWLERPINYKRPWTKDEDSIILAGRRLGKSYKEIAKELDGRTPKAATNRMYQIMKKMRERDYEIPV